MAPAAAFGANDGLTLTEVPLPAPGSATLNLAPATLEWIIPPQPTEAAQQASPAQPSGDAAKDAPEAPATKPDQQPAKLNFGDVGSMWVTLGTGAAWNGDFTDINIFGALSYFIGKDVEFMGELGAWQFSQPGPDATGFNASMVIRWHFLDTGKWTLYGDIGIGLLLATEQVPRRDGLTGTNFDFTPRFGGGFTRQLSDDGTRLEVGLRWAHVSNARISGNNDNPGRDSVMLYAGLIFPF